MSYSALISGIFSRHRRNNPKMVRQLRLHFLLICIPLVLCLLSVAHAGGKRNVLILNSYHHGYKWTDDETQGILSQLDSMKSDVKIYIEYMGTKWINDKQYFEKLRDMYKHKFRRVPFDVIIATDNDAFDFLRWYRDDVFGKIHVVFCGVNWFKDEDLRGYSLFTGVNEDADIAATLNIMLKLHPQTKHIYFVIDSTTTGRIIHDKVQEIMPLYRSKVTFHLLEDMAMEKVIDTVANVPENSLVLLTLFQEDKAGVFFEFSESTSMISGSSRVPVYGLWDFNLGFGIVGGMLTSGSAQGNSAGALALRILRGESADAIPVIMNSPNKYMFDYRQMERFGIKSADLPPHSIIINEPSSFYAVNKRLLWGAVSGMAGLTIVIFILLVNIQRRKRAEESLRRARNGLEITVQERTADLVKVNEMLHTENTERRRAEEEVKKLIGEIGEFNQQMETLMSERTMSIMALTVADKVRNPAALIAGVCSRLLEKGDVAEPLKESLEIITDGARKIEVIVNDFQALLKSRQSKFTYVDLNSIVDGVVSLIKKETDAKGIQLAVDISLRPLMINTHMDLLRVAIFHVIKNALESTPKGGTISVSTSKENNLITLVISDTGSGIPKEVIERIFDPFFTTKEWRFGMGLPLVKQIIAEHMGEIAVKSEEGSGTTCRIVFPSRWKETP